MSHYDNCSREELIGRIEELEARLASAADTAGRFRDGTPVRFWIRFPTC